MSFLEDLNDGFEKLMQFREATGYATDTYRSSIPPFINYCGKNYPNARYMIHPPKVFFGLQIPILSIFSGKMTIREGRSEFAMIPNVLLIFDRNVRISYPSAIPLSTP